MNTLAILRWDPTIRGLLFPGIQFLFLVGSCYLILATNVGNRLGFLISSAAFWGWMALMAIIWLIYGIGPKGNDPKWKHTEEVFSMKYAQSEKVKDLGDGLAAKKLAKGWTELDVSSPIRGEAQSTIDAHIGKDAINWVSIGAYEVGGEQRIKIWPKVEKPKPAELLKVKKAKEANDKLPKAQQKLAKDLYQAPKYKWYNPADYKFNGLLHGKRQYVGLQQEALKEQKVVDGVKQFDDAGKPIMTNVLELGKPVANPKGKIVYHVLTRDLGTRRARSFRVFFFSTILTIISLIALHYRDRKVMAAMGRMKAKAA